MTTSLITNFIASQQPKPIEFARVFYGLYNNVPFEADLAEYLNNGFVVVRPTCILLMRLANIAKKGEPEEIAWYVRFAYGNLLEICQAFPAYLPKVVFNRVGFGKPINAGLHTVDYNRVVALAKSQQRARNHNGQG